MLDTITSLGSSTLGSLWPLVWNIVKIVALVLPLMICVARARTASARSAC